MVAPNVQITELDGQLGVLPPSSGALLALVGACSAGTANVPATYAKIKDVVAAFGAGPLVEAAARHIEQTGRPVLLVKSAASVAASISAVTSTATGTSVVTASLTPNDDYELYLRFTTGGTRGTTGAQFQWSLDGGRTLSPITDLGTAIEFVFPGAGGVKFAFAAGTFVAGDVHTARCTAAMWNSSDIGAALDALGASIVTWEICEIVGAIDATTFDAIDAKFTGFAALRKYRAWIGHPRIPNIGESEATYLAAMVSAFGSKSTKLGNLCAGACKLTSSVSGRKYKRPISYVVASREADVSEEIAIAQIPLGALVGVSIRDSNGNADEHDEALNPGLDDARFTTLRTHEGRQGVFVTRSRVFSQTGSDFDLFPKRRVMNLGLAALYNYFLDRMSKDVFVDETTGFITEAEAAEIEAGAVGALAGVLMQKPKASAVQFTLSRTDNVLSTKTLTGQARIVPKGYTEFITLDIAFKNPALSVQTAG